MDDWPQQGTAALASPLPATGAIQGTGDPNMTNLDYERRSASARIDPPGLSGLDIALGVMLLVMVWGPMTAAAFLHPMGTQFVTAQQQR
jgi:hypothetical protein